MVQPWHVALQSASQQTPSKHCPEQHAEAFVPHAAPLAPHVPVPVEVVEAADVDADDDVALVVDEAALEALVVVAPDPLAVDAAFMVPDPELVAFVGPEAVVDGEPPWPPAPPPPVVLLEVVEPLTHSPMPASCAQLTTTNGSVARPK